MKFEKVEIFAVAGSVKDLQPKLLLKSRSTDFAMLQHHFLSTIVPYFLGYHSVSYSYEQHQLFATSASASACFR